jgi:hypothetical protein
MLRQEFDAWWPELKAKLDGLAKLAPEATETGFDWLYTLEDLARIQDSGAWRDIWIVSPNLYRNTFKPPIRAVMQKNIAAKVTYRFIVPATHGGSDVGKDALTQILTNASVKEIPEDDFSSLAVTDYVILYPASATAAPQVFLELPISPNGYWIQVDEEGALGFIRRFCKLGQFTQP